MEFRDSSDYRVFNHMRAFETVGSRAMWSELWGVYSLYDASYTNRKTLALAATSQTVS